MGWGCQEPKVVKLYALLLNLAQVENNIKLWHKAARKLSLTKYCCVFSSRLAKEYFLETSARWHFGQSSTHNKSCTWEATLSVPANLLVGFVFFCLEKLFSLVSLALW